MNWHRRGQTSLEFIVLAGFMLFVFTAFIFVVKERSNIANQQVRYNELSSVAQSLNQEVINAYRVQDGYTRTFEIPNTINGEQYTIKVTDNSELTLTTTESKEEYLLFLPANITVVDGGGIPTVNLLPGKVTIGKQDGNITIKGAIVEPDTCNFMNSAGLMVSCYPSTGGGCTTAAGASSCTVGVTGTLNQKVTWISSCTPVKIETTYNGVPKDVNFTCVSSTETFTCSFTGTTLAQSCWSSKGQYCAGKPNCAPPSVSGIWGETILWGSSCGVTRAVLLDSDDANNVITFDCSNPVTETITCKFLENPLSGAQHTCYWTGDPRVNCTSTTGQCTITPQFPPGTGLEWASDCRGGASMYVTNEQKTLPFFCSTS